MLCDASGDLDWISALAAPIGGLAAARCSYQWFPLLPDPDPNDRPTDRDRKMFKRTYAVSILIALCCAVLLVVALTPAHEPMRFVGKASIVVGPTLLLFGVFGFVLPEVAKHLVRAGPLLHLISKPKRLGRTIDERRFMRASSVMIIVLAIWVHCGLAGLHTTFEEQGVRWRSWPWHGEQTRTWSEMTELQIVGSYENFVGRTVSEPHLVLTFEPSVQLVVGVFEGRRKGWDEPAAYASAHSGIAVRSAKK